MKTKNFSKHKVFWAEDDVDDLFIMRDVLQRINTNHDIVEASNGRDLLQRLQAIEHPSDFPCLIVLDMNMPVLDGRQTILRIREQEQYNDIPIVVFTTSSSEYDKAFCRNNGVQMFTKPSGLHDLQQTIIELLTHCNKVSEEAPAPMLKN